MDFIPKTRRVLFTSKGITIADFAVARIASPFAIGKRVTIGGIAFGAAASVRAKTIIDVVEGEKIAHDLIGLEDAVVASVTSTLKFFRERTAVELSAATIQALELTLRIPFATDVGTTSTLRKLGAGRSSEKVADSPVGEDLGQGVEGKAHFVDDVRNETVDGHAFSIFRSGVIGELLDGDQRMLFGVEGNTHNVDVVELENGGHQGIVVTDFRSSHQEEDAAASA